MKKLTLKSVWIIPLNLFAGTIILGILSQTIEFINGDGSFSSIFSIGILGSILGFITYGMIFLIPLMLFQFLTSLVFIKKNATISDLKKLFIVESLLVTILFASFAINHDYPMWYFFIVIFIFSQYRRYILIKKET